MKFKRYLSIVLILIGLVMPLAINTNVQASTEYHATSTTIYSPSDNGDSHDSSNHEEWTPAQRRKISLKRAIAASATTFLVLLILYIFKRIIMK